MTGTRPFCIVGELTMSCTSSPNGRWRADLRDNTALWLGVLRHGIVSLNWAVGASSCNILELISAVVC